MTKLSANISSKFFRGSKKPEDILEELMKAKVSGKENYIPLGRLIGHGVSFEMTSGKMPDGQEKDSLHIIGKFEATNYETGEVKEAAGAYLPKYFGKMIQAHIQKSSEDGVSFAIELGVELTGRAIPWAWVVVNLMPADATDPIEKMKTKLSELKLLSNPVHDTKTKAKAA